MNEYNNKCLTNVWMSKWKKGWMSDWIKELLVAETLIPIILPIVPPPKKNTITRLSASIAFKIVNESEYALRW